MMVCLDACIIIYWVEMAQPFYSKFINQLSKINLKYPNAEIAVSRLSFLECCVNPMRAKDQAMLKMYRDFFSNPNLTIIEINEHIIEAATELRANYRLRTPDAIQAASAMLSESIFMSNDKSFKSIKGLSIELI